MKNFSDEQVTQIAGRSRALGDATRVRILAVLARGEQAVGQIAGATGTQQSTASKHLQVLFHAGLVHRRRAASTVIYSIASDELYDWCRFLGTRSLTHAPRARIEPTHAAEAKTSSSRNPR